MAPVRFSNQSVGTREEQAMQGTDRTLVNPPVSSREAFAELDRRTAERRQVTHEDNGAVWGPGDQLLKLVSVCNVLDAVAAGADGYDRPHLAQCLRDQAKEIRQALGIE
jgi:hypothetical protein